MSTSTSWLAAAAPGPGRRPSDVVVPQPPTHQGSAATLVRGVSPVLEVPFTGNGGLDVDGFNRVVRHVLSAGVTAMMFPGFASEFHKLSDAERDLLRDELLQHTRERKDVAAIISVPDHATRLAVEHAVAAVERGADVINVLPPHFLQPGPGAVVAHLAAVLHAVVPVPVIVQYAPGQTGTALDAGTLADLARQHSNLTMVKVESTPPGRLIAALAAQQPALPAMVGYAGVQLPDAVRRGAIGVQPGCSFIEIYVSIWQHFSNGDEAAALALHGRLLPYLSYWMQHVELIVAVEKLVSKRRGLIGSAHCRSPAYELDAHETAMVDRFLHEFGPMLAEVPL